MSDLCIEIKASNGQVFSQPLGLFIGNEFVKSAKGETIPAIDPATELEITVVYAASELDVDIAVRAARKALTNASWKDLSPAARGQLMFKFAELIEEHKEVLATIEAMDNGKPYSMALGEDVPELISVIRYYAGWCDKISGKTIITNSSKLAYTIRQPVGVVGQIIPWNFPLAMAAWKLGPALACGNTVVLKAAEQTPLSILYLATLIKEAGFPPGVVNILNGLGVTAGAAIVSHPNIDKIAFTGSTVTGRSIAAMAAGTLKNITLETGGKSPLLVFDDADLEQAARWAYLGAFYNQGQVCSATSRILVQEAVHDRFVALLKEEIGTTSVGSPFAEGTTQGPQVSSAQHKKVLSYIALGQREGATVATGGNDLRQTVGNGKGYYVAPTLFTDVLPHMQIYKEEIFGPVVVVSKFTSEEQAIAMANDSEYGLAAAVFTKDSARSLRIAADLEAGMVWVNSSNDLDIRVPFGGIKQSEATTAAGQRYDNVAMMTSQAAGSE